jgi:hypothetical protein
LEKMTEGFEKATEGFEFKQCISILKSTGRKAKTLNELRTMITIVPDSCIFHHTYQYFLKEHVFEYTNDFAHWAGESLEERALAEQLSSIDPYEFKNIDDLRKQLLFVINDYLEKFPEPREVLSGDEFFFNETISLVFSVGIRAKNLAEFLMAVKYIDFGSIYYHFYEARIRTGGGIDDFSKWIEESIGKNLLAEKLRTIDPFMNDIEGIKKYIVNEVEIELRKDMETVRKEL